MEAHGAQRTDDLAEADVVVINTCTVTAEADRDARALIRKIRRANPNSRIVVTGCYAQRAPQEIAALAGVSAVIGNSHKDQAAEFAMKLVTPTSPPAQQNLSTDGFVPLSSLHPDPSSPGATPFLLHESIFAHSDFHLPPLLAPNGVAHRTRPSLKIQDGCGNRCTFCVIPSTRGNSRSLSAAGVLMAVQEFVDAGGKEMVISGINLGRWGRDLAPQTCLEDLLAEILETTTLPRLRISSIEPMDWGAGLIALLARWGTGEHPRLARHVHMPLQSGSDGVLRRMHRRYRPWHYAERLTAVRAALPEAAIGADVMVGFPGETDAEFQENYDFIAAQPLTYLHLFPFSARPGTPAWELNRQSPLLPGVVHERMAALRGLIDSKNEAFRSTFLGKSLSVVTLVSSTDRRNPQAKPQHSTALSDNFIPVELDRFLPPNILTQVRITEISGRGLRAAVPPPETALPPTSNRTSATRLANPVNA